MIDIHHIICEKSGKHYCLYCGQKFEMRDWRSELFAEKHYKEIKCRNCKKKSRIKVAFMGSGHDNWSGLEKRVIREAEKKEKDDTGN